MIFMALVSCQTGKETKTTQFVYPVSAHSHEKALDKVHIELDNETYKERGFFVGEIFTLKTYYKRINNLYA